MPNVSHAYYFRFPALSASTDRHRSLDLNDHASVVVNPGTPGSRTVTV